VLSAPFSNSIRIPMPRVTVAVQAPFEIPSQPESILDVWVAAIWRLLDQANGLAADRLATWKQQRGRSEC
jgi:hypothetical protein